MRFNIVLGVFAVLTVGSAHAQNACTPRDTPDMGAEQPNPVLFSQCVAENKCGAIDKTGAWKIPPVHRDVLIEEEFIVVPENDDWNKYSFLDSDGKRLGGGDYTISIEEQLPVSEGLMAVLSNDRVGYVDHTGTLIIPAQFEEGESFQDGLALVVVGGKNKFIDKTGKPVFEVPEGYSSYAFSGDVAVAEKGGMQGLIGRDGAVVMSPAFSSLYDDNGVLIAIDGDKMGIVSREGKFISPTNFGTIGRFSKGLAPAEADGKWGFIDTCGAWKIEPKYDMANGFEGGPARVKTGDKWGLIDTSGREILPPTFAHIGEGVWTEGLASYSPDDTKYGIIDTTGKVVVEAKFDSVEPVGGGVLMSYSGEEEKLLNLDGSEIRIADAP